MLSKFFQRKPASTDPSKLSAAIITRDAQGRLLALGLKWRVMVSGGSVSSAKRMASESFANHYTVLNGQTVGLALITSKSKKDAPSIWSAASAACKKFGGDGVFALSLSANEAWCFVMRNGLPTGAENIFVGDKETGEGSDDVALQFVRESQASLPSIRIYSDLSLDFGVEVTPFSLTDFSSMQLQVGDKLTQVVDNSKPKVPLPVLATVVIGLCSFGGWTYYKDWNAAQIAQKRLKNQVKIQPVDPLVSWKAAIQNSVVNFTEPNNDAIKLVRESFNRVPVKIDGWNLTGAKCLAGLQAQTLQKWSCRAEYTATTAVNTATNLQLTTKVPTGFVAVFSPLSAMALTWDVSSKVMPVKLDSLPERKEHLVGTASRIQPLLLALTNASNFAFEPVKVVAPLSKEGNVPIPKPASVVVPSVAAITFSGPLRSIDACLTKTIPAQWNSITFSMTSKPAVATADNLSLLKQSVVSATLSGNLYAKQ